MKEKYKNLRIWSETLTRLKINSAKSDYQKLTEYLNELSKVKLDKKVINSPNNK